MNVEEVCGTHLSSRGRAAELRASLFASPSRLVLDFSGVVALSASFADELFGVLVIEKGLEWIRDNVGVENASKSVMRALLTAIDRRRNQAA